jgi:hypothetical protein
MDWYVRSTDILPRFLVLGSNPSLIVPEQRVPSHYTVSKTTQQLYPRPPSSEVTTALVEASRWELKPVVHPVDIVVVDLCRLRRVGRCAACPFVATVTAAAAELGLRLVVAMTLRLIGRCGRRFGAADAGAPLSA